MPYSHIWLRYFVLDILFSQQSCFVFIGVQHLPPFFAAYKCVNLQKKKKLLQNPWICYKAIINLWKDTSWTLSRVSKKKRMMAVEFDISEVHSAEQVRNFLPKIPIPVILVSTWKHQLCWTCLRNRTINISSSDL